MISDETASGFGGFLLGLIIAGIICTIISINIIDVMRESAIKNGCGEYYKENEFSEENKFRWINRNVK